MSFKKRVIKGSLWSLAGGAGQQIISFLIFLYLAKLLDARAIGIVASAAILTDLTVVFARMGLVEAIQRHDADHRIESAAWWCSALAGALGSSILIGSALILKALGTDDEIADVLLMLSPATFLSATSAVQEGLIRKRLDFRALTFRSWGATLIGGGAAILAFSMNYGLYALVAQRVATATVSAILIWLQAGWRPSWRPELRPASIIVRDGGMILVGSFSGIINARVSDAITTLLLGPTALGFFRLASRFSDVMVQVLVTPIVAVALPSFAALQNDRDALERTYLRLTQFMAAASIPAFFGLGAVAEPFLTTILGAKWLGATIIFQLMGFSITAGAVNYFFAPLMVATGRADVVMKQSLSQIFIGIFLILGGAHFGMVGVAIATVIRGAIVNVMNVYIINRLIGVKYRNIIYQWLPPFICAIMMYAITKSILSLINFQPYAELIIGITIGSISYTLLLVAGDFSGIWRHYVRGAFHSLRGRVGASV
ncbi:MAG: lipopolysaccharide biosynthesis protein [bacterium]|nr:lipopolysaccharide biosynthesis protein [bacterium]